MENFVPITPINFFQICIDCHYVEPDFPNLSGKGFNKLIGSKLRKYLLPDMSELCHEFSFADIAMGWNRDGIEVHAAISQSFRQARYPEVSQGDSLELFFDTRDVKTSGFNTKFCHHFFFLPEAVEGHHAGELTRFRTEDTHELCDAADLKVRPQLKNSGYSLQIFIPTQCLFGYDPDQFDRLGFAYRVNRSSGPPQHFCVVSDDYQIEQQPSLWSSVRLVK